MRRIAITLSLVLLATLATSHAQWQHPLRPEDRPQRVQDHRPRRP